jgi:DnaK suppressor protein
LNLELIERELRQRHAELQERLAMLSKPPERGADLGFGKRVGDGTTEAVARLTDVGVGESLELSDERVLRALAKLDEGSYGTCDRCGKPIAEGRLKARPDSVLCIDCA